MASTCGLQVLATFAKHYKTGEPIPADLVERMNRAAAFGRADSVSTQNAYSAMSYDYYKGDPNKTDMDAIPSADFNSAMRTGRAVLKSPTRR